MRVSRVEWRGREGGRGEGTQRLGEKRKSPADKLHAWKKPWRHNREGKSEEGGIVGSRDINSRRVCAEGGGSLFTGFSDPLLETTLHWPPLSSRSLISATKFHPTPPLSRNKGWTREREVCTRERERGLLIRSCVFTLEYEESAPTNAWKWHVFVIKPKWKI